MRLRVFAFVAAFLASVAPLSANPAFTPTAENESLTFYVYVYGLKMGLLQVGISQNEDQYAAKGRVATTGLVDKISRFHFDGEVHGSKDGTRYWPDTYSATIVKRQSEDAVRMRYDNRTPVVMAYLPQRAPRADDVDPSKQRGAVDLISSAYMVLRDAPKEEICGKSIQMYDGRRRSQIKLEPPKFQDGKASCTGFYERLAGFSMGEMAKQTVFPFTFDYEMQKDGSYRLMRVSTDTTIGPAHLVRKD